jgi:hypothetical protein
MKQPLWIFLAALVMSISSAANATPGDILVTREDGVDVYDAPSAAAQILITIDEGRKLKELKREGVWVKVIIYGEIGKDGWLHSSSVAPESAEIEEAAQPDVSDDGSAGPAGTSPGPQFTLAITGTPKQRFQARCKSVDRGRAAKKSTFVGQIPSTYVITGESVSCRVHRLANYAGWIRVKLYEQGSTKPLGSAQTDAKNGCVSVRSKGRWGKAWDRESCASDRSNW